MFFEILEFDEYVAVTFVSCLVVIITGFTDWRKSGREKYLEDNQTNEIKNRIDLMSNQITNLEIENRVQSRLYFDSETRMKNSLDEFQGQYDDLNEKFIRLSMYVESLENNDNENE